MTDKTFPPPQALRVVPLAEAEIMRKWMSECRKPWLAGSPLLRLVEFVEQFRPQDCPDMAILAGNVREIKITDASVDEEQIDLVRLNGRVYAPEIIAVAGNGEELTLETVDKVVETLEAINPTPDGIGDAIRLIRYMADELQLPRKSLDVDDLEQIITETLEPDWAPRLAARAVHAEIYGEAE